MTTKWNTFVTNPWLPKVIDRTPHSSNTSIIQEVRLLKSRLSCLLNWKVQTPEYEAAIENTKRKLEELWISKHEIREIESLEINR